MSTDQPNDNGSGKPNDNSSDDVAEDIEKRIEELAEQFLRDLLAGKANLKQLVDGFPQLSPSLEKRLKLVESLFVISKQQADPGDTVDSDPAKNKSNKRSLDHLADERAIRLNCPHCGIRLQLVDSQRVAEITCDGCGSTVQIDPELTPSVRSAVRRKRIGRFEVVELIGRGGFGSVYKARDPVLSRFVAIKVPREGYFCAPEERARFLREARHAARLRHPRIVQVHEIAEDDEFPYIITEFIDGLTLNDLIGGRRTSFRQGAELMVNIAEAIEYAHSQNVIHRDIKPSNILMDGAGHPFIADFGLSLDAEKEITMTLDGEVLGTPAYMSPEQARGHSAMVDVRSDVYSLGVVLYRLLCGELPFRGSKRMLIYQVLNDDPRPLRRLNDLVPRDLEIITLKAMAKEPNKRYATAQDFADDLQRWLRNEPIRARPETISGRFLKWCRRKPLVAALTTAVALLIIAGTALSIVWAIRETGLTKIANQNLSLANQKQQESNSRLQQLYVQNGVRLMELADPLSALSWFALGLESETDDDSIHRLRFKMILDQSPKLTELWAVGKTVRYATYSAEGTSLLAVNEQNDVQVYRLDAGEADSQTFAHPNLIQAAEFDPTGERIIVAAGKQAYVWNVKTGESIAVLEHAEIVIAASFNWDGTKLATSAIDGTSKIWNTSDGNLLHVLDHPTREVRQAMFVATSTNYLTVSTDGELTNSQLTIWDAETGTRLQMMQLDDQVLDVAFNESGTRVVSADLDQQAILWDATTGQRIGNSMQHGAPVRHVFFLADNVTIVTVTDNGTIAKWDAATGERLGEDIRQDIAVLQSVLSPDSTFVASACADGKVRVRWLDSGEPVCGNLPHGSSTSGIAFHPNGRMLLAGGNDGALKQWDLAGLAPKSPILKHEDAVIEARFSPTGDRIVTCSRDASGGIWITQSGQRIGNLLSHDLDLMDCDFSSNGKYVVTSSADKSAQVWDAYSGLAVGPKFEHPDNVLRVAFSPEPQDRLVTATSTGDAFVWKVGSSDSLYKVTQSNQSKEIRSIAFTNDGDRFATASSDNTVRIWNASDGSSVGLPLNHDGPVTYCRFDNSGRWLAAASGDQTATIWTLTDLAQPVQKLLHAAGVTSCSFSADGNRLLTTDFQGAATIWKKVDQLFEQEWHFEFGNYMLMFGEFSPRGNLIAVCGERLRAFDRRPGNGAIFLLDAELGVPVAPPLSHLALVRRIHFNGQGDTLLSASADNTARIWQLRQAAMNAQALSRYAQLLAGQVVDQRLQLAALSAEAQRTYFDNLQSSNPELFRCTSVEIKQWNEYVEWVTHVAD